MLDAKNDPGCCPNHWWNSYCSLVADANCCQSRIFLHKIFTIGFIIACRHILDTSQSESDPHKFFKSFCYPEKAMTTCCLQRDYFSGNVAVFNLYKWRQSDVIVIKLTAATQNEISYKMYILNFFSNLRFNGMALFCKLIYRTTLVEQIFVAIMQYTHIHVSVIILLHSVYYYGTICTRILASVNYLVSNYTSFAVVFTR